MAEAYKLATRMDLSASQELVTYLLSVPKSDETVLDASDVTHMGALCAQALIAAGLRSTKSGGSFKIINVDERVTSQLGSMGLTVETIMEGRV